MKFLGFMSGEEFLLAYPVYCAIIIILFYVVMKSERKQAKSYIIEQLTSEDVFILNTINKKDIRGLIGYFTYGLLVKGYIESLNKNKGIFKIKTREIDYNDELNEIEERIIDKFREDNVSFNSVANNSSLVNMARNYYDNKCDEFEKRGLIDVVKMTKMRKMKVIATFTLSLIPGILRIFSGLINEKPVTYLIFEVIFITIILNIVNSHANAIKVTEKGRKSIKVFKDTNKGCENDDNIDILWSCIF